MAWFLVTKDTPDGQDVEDLEVAAGGTKALAIFTDEVKARACCSLHGGDGDEVCIEAVNDTQLLAWMRAYADKGQNVFVLNPAPIEAAGDDDLEADADLEARGMAPTELSLTAPVTFERPT